MRAASPVEIGRAFALSLPLMGIENRPSGPIGPISQGLITPHGDRKHAGASCPRHASLPLITPHGDRKRSSDGVRTGPQALITPHGDRKRDSMYGRPDPGWLSLPLMGIGNFSYMVMMAPRLMDSLPLMGIGNTGIAGGYTSPATCSLPLMGIGNHQQDRSDAQHLRLITPHGDRKLDDPLKQRPRLLGPHYPSWGSETPHASINALPADSSLPLMGIGNTQPGGLTLARAPSSLPLMGIGNPWNTGSTRARPLTAHYPSWGSETPVRPAP